MERTQEADQHRRHGRRRRCLGLTPVRGHLLRILGRPNQGRAHQGVAPRKQEHGPVNSLRQPLPPSLWNQRSPRRPHGGRILLSLVLACGRPCSGRFARNPIVVRLQRSTWGPRQDRRPHPLSSHERGIGKGRRQPRRPFAALYSCLRDPNPAHDDPSIRRPPRGSGRCSQPFPQRDHGLLHKLLPCRTESLLDLLLPKSPTPLAPQQAHDDSALPRPHE